MESATLRTASPLYERGKINACADDEKEIETKTGAELGARRKNVDFFFSSRDEDKQAATKMARQDKCEDLQCHRVRKQEISRQPDATRSIVFRASHKAENQKPFKSKVVEEQQ
ncbi:hypothetical protein B0T13DRAFT_515104 [Neurospora crassa]|nr:hypothetical protein B0T13DRAFT_515104 [Neurospora crassa]